MREFERNKYYARHIIGIIASTIYDFAPRNRPRDMDKIMNYVADTVDSCCVDLKDCRYILMTSTEFAEWLDRILKACPEFCNLNLTQNEVDRGITVDDESRLTNVFVSAFDPVTDESWRRFCGFRCSNTLYAQSYRENIGRR